MVTRDILPLSRPKGHDKKYIYVPLIETMGYKFKNMVFTSYPIGSRRIDVSQF